MYQLHIIQVALPLDSKGLIHLLVINILAPLDNVYHN